MSKTEKKTSPSNFTYLEKIRYQISVYMGNFDFLKNLHGKGNFDQK